MCSSAYTAAIDERSSGKPEGSSSERVGRHAAQSVTASARRTIGRPSRSWVRVPLRPLTDRDHHSVRSQAVRLLVHEVPSCSYRDRRPRPPSHQDFDGGMSTSIAQLGRTRDMTGANVVAARVPLWPIRRYPWWAVMQDG